MNRSLFALFLAAATLHLPTGVRAQVDTGRSVPMAPLTRIRAADWGASVIVIDSAEIARSTAQTFSELLQARRPGVRVLRQGGMANDGALVMLRGPMSVAGSNEPIVIVDGVRVDSRQSDLPNNEIGSSVAPSRLDDLIPEDIERIEILSGPAAALYGDQAAYGVILVTTKSGDAGPLQLSGRATWDASQMRDVFPANYHRTGVSPTTGQPVADCSLGVVASGQCTPTGLDVWNPLQQASPFRTGNSARGHLAVGGSALGTSIFAGVTGDERQGTLPHDEASRLALRVKVSRVLPWRLGVEATAGYLRDNARIGVDGNTIFRSNVIGNGLLGSAVNDTNRGYFVGAGTPGDSLFPDQQLRHRTLGARLNWQPFDWLGASIGSGADRVTAHSRNDRIVAATSTTPDESGSERHELQSSSVRVTVTHQFSPWLATATDIGAEHVKSEATSYDSTAFQGTFQTISTESRNSSTSLLFSQRATFEDQLTVNASVQRLASSAFGASTGKEWFPSGNISWSVPGQSYVIHDLRARVAYAEAAGPTRILPALGQAIPIGYGPPLAPFKPKMERTRTFEGGVDALLATSTYVTLTAFTSTSSHLWVPQPFPNYGNVAFLQGATMRNGGAEALIATPLVNARRIRWTGSLSIAVLRNRVTHLDGPPIRSSIDPIAQDYPFGGVWATTYTYADANHDGIIGTDEVQAGPLQFMGPALPTFESSLDTDLELPGHVVVSGTLDYRSGNRVLDLTTGLRCNFPVCQASQDPTASLADQAAAVASRSIGLSNAGYAEDGTFLRLRELALHWTLPAVWTRFAGSHAEFTIAGRNLATWTKYRGLDPEISYLQTPDLPRQELLNLPLPRELIVRLDVGARIVKYQ